MNPRALSLLSAGLLYKKKSITTPNVWASVLSDVVCGSVCKPSNLHLRSKVVFYKRKTVQQDISAYLMKLGCYFAVLCLH